MTRLLLVALLTFAPVVVAQAPATSPPVAAAEADGVRARLAQPAVLRGGFEQRKQLQGFRNPLVSRGRFLLLRERGIAWDTTEPFASTVLLTRERLLTRLPDGRTRVVLDARASPGMAAVNALLMALVAGDLDTLAPQFEATETLLPEGAWTLELKPREAALQRVFRRIELRGDRHVREVHIEETAGDTSTIRFLALDDQPATASAEEAARFD